MLANSTSSLVESYSEVRKISWPYESKFAEIGARSNTVMSVIRPSGLSQGISFLGHKRRLKSI